MSAKVYYLVGQTEEEKRDFLDSVRTRGTGQDYPQEHLVVKRDETIYYILGNGNYYKSVHHPLSIPPTEIENL